MSSQLADPIPANDAADGTLQLPDLRKLLPVWAEIDLDRLKDNLRLIRNRIKPGTEIMAVLKGDAYGHGGTEIAQALQRLGIRFFAAASVVEGIRLRRAGIQGVILVLEAIFPEQLAGVLEYNLTPTLNDPELMKRLASEGRRRQRRIQAHLRIDCGADGIGFSAEDCPALAEKLSQMDWLEVQGIFTHLPSAYRGDRQGVADQLGIFKRVVDDFTAAGTKIPWIHAASSIPILTTPEAHCNMVRPGMILYGIPPLKGLAEQSLRPVMSIKSRLVLTGAINENVPLCSYHSSPTKARLKKYGIVSLGYGDALFLLTIGKGEVLIGGRRAPVIANARMDRLFVDIGDIPEAAVGGEVVILGEQGEEKITAREATLAAGLPEINSDSVCMLTSRVSRVYLENQQVVKIAAFS